MSFLADIGAFKESRLQSLYSDFSERKELNPEGYAANIEAWLTALDAYLKHGDNGKVTFTPHGFGHAVKNGKYGEPKGLSSVIEEAIRRKKVSKFKAPEGWRGLLQLFVGLSINESDKYVHLKNLASMSEKAYSRLVEMAKVKHTDAVHTPESLYKALASMGLSHTDVDAIEAELSKQKKLTVTDDYVKVGAPSEEDKAIARLKDALLQVEQRVEQLEIPKNVKTRRDLVRKKHAEKTLERHLGALDQLRRALDEIDNAYSNLSTLKSMETASSVLKALNLKLPPEEAEKVRVQLQDQMDMADEVTASLQAGTESDVEEELRELEREMAQETANDDELLSKLSGLKVSTEAPSAPVTNEEPEAPVRV